MTATGAAFSVVGRPIPRVEGPDKVTGAARYSADVTIPDLLWGKNVRSPHPHARIVSIDTSRARRVPGVRAVLTAADVPAKRVGRSIRDYEVICSDRVRFIGDIVAVLAAEDPDAAEEAALLVAVEYEELPAVFDPIAAMQPDAPLIHPDVRSYQGFPKDVPEDFRNVCSLLVVDRGDLQAGFADADVVIENTFTTQLMHQGYIEPHACVVRVGEGGRLEVWATNKIPFAFKSQLSDTLDRPPEDVLIHRVNIGGEFGSKANLGDVPAACYLARATGRPVKFVTSPHEDLTATTPRHPSVIQIRTGAKRDGTLTAWDARVVWNSGAYGGLKPAIFGGNLGGSNNAAGWFEIPNLHIDARMVYTNQVPCAYMRAPGQPQAVFAVEVQMDLLARELSMDPLEIRLRNLPTRMPNGEECLAPRVLRAAADGIGWSRPKATHVGRGLGLAARGTGAGPSTSDITLNPDGTITAVTSVPDNGTGGLTVVAQIVAEVWGVPIGRVHLVHGDTDSVPVDVGSGGSSITNAAGHAAIAASRKVQEQLAPLAASILGLPTATWEGGAWRADGRAVSVRELASEMIKPGDPSAHAQVTVTPERSPNQQFCAQAAEVAVDPETGQVRIRQLVAAQDVGTIINEIGHQGQIEGCVIQGVGYALMEDLAVTDGRIAAASLGDYKVPTIVDIPQLATIHIPAAGPGPFNAKGIGETPTVPTAAAVANAVADAVGSPVFSLPISPEGLSESIQGAQEEQCALGQQPLASPE